MRNRKNIIKVAMHNRWEASSKIKSTAPKPQTKMRSRRKRRKMKRKVLVTWMLSKAD